MKKAWRFVLLVLVLGVLAGAYWYYDNRVASASTATSEASLTQVVTVEQGSLNATLSVVGSLEAVQSADLTFEETSGTAQLLSLEVQAGETVTAGQVLATIDPAPYQQALDQAKNDLETAEGVLADLTTPPTGLEIAKADVAVAAAQVDLESAQAALEDLENPDLAELEATVTDARVALAQSKVDLLALEQASTAENKIAALREADAKVYAVYLDWANKIHSETDQEYHDQLMLVYNKIMDAQDALVTAEAEARVSLLKAQITVRNREQALAAAQEALVEARAGGDKLGLAQAKLAVRRAEVALEAAQEDRADLEAGADATEVAAAQAEVDKGKLAVSDAEAALAGTELVAPFDGTILETHVSAGDAVGPSTLAVTLANLKSMQVVASVDETTIREVSAGQKASISFDAYPDQTFEGEVLSVPLQGTLQGDVTVYEVPLSLSGAEELDLLVGMTANVEIEVGQVSDALLVPTLALVKANGGYQVLVPNTTDAASDEQAVTGDPETVPVQIGLSNGTYTQIVKGLNAGDQVIVQLDSTSSTGNFQNGNSSVFSSIFRFMGGR